MKLFSRHSAARVSPGASVGRVNQAGELVWTPWLHQMAMEGRLFMAGTGVEEAGVTGQVSAAGPLLDETTPTFSLVSPLGGKLIIPISFTLYRDTEGANDQAENALLHLAYTQLEKGHTGTLMDAINMRGDDSPEAQARFLHTVTIDATVADEYVSLAMRIHIIEGWQNTETVILGGSETEGYGASVAHGPSVFEFNYDFLKKHVPLVLTGGSSITVYTTADGTADTFNSQMIWLELPADKYGL